MSHAPYRIPTTAQAVAIRLLSEHPARIENGRFVQPVPQGRRKVTPAARAALTENAWIEVPEEGADGPVTVTEFGLREAGDREALNFYRSLTYKEQRRVQVTPRPRGNSQIRGLGGNHAGRNVTCWPCVRAAKEEYDRREAAGERGMRSPYCGPFWYTNEANAQRDAEVVAGKHYLRHLNGDLPPFKDEG